MRRQIVRNGMHELNLLPMGVVRQQQRRRFTGRLITAEAVIFLGVIVFALWAFNTLRQTRERTVYLETRLDDARYADSDRLADAVKIAEVDRDARLTLSNALPGAVMDYAWLEAVNRTLPPGVTLVEVDIRDTHITLIAAAANWREAERHRAALATCGLFVYARFGAASRTDDGQLRYGLALGVA